MSSERPSTRADRFPAARDVDALYGLPLDEFTSARNRLVKSLRGDGETEAAASVASLRKPTLAAWTVNQLVRGRREDVEALLEAGKRMVEAQRRNDPEAMRVRQAEQRSAVTALVSAAERTLGPGATAATMRAVAETLRAASITDDGRELLAAGRLTGPITTTGWEIVAGSPPTPRRASARADTAADADRRSRSRLERRLRGAEDERKEALGYARELERAEQDARRAAAHAEREVRKAQARVSRLEERIAGIRKEIEALDSRDLRE